VSYGKVNILGGWNVIQITSKNFPTVFKKKSGKNVTEKWGFLRKTSYRQN